MRFLRTLLLFGAFFWVWDFSDGTAYADVRDTTGTFSKETIEQANATIAEVEQKYNKDVVVEVFPSVPQNLRPGNAVAVNDQVIKDWAASRVKELKVNGVYVLINLDPSKLNVITTEDAQRGFTRQDTERLRGLLIDRFRGKQFDQGLIDGVNFVRRSFEANVGARSGQPNYNVQAPSNSGGGVANVPTPQRKSTGIGWIWWVIIIGVSLFLLMRFLRRRAQLASPGGFPVQPGHSYGRDAHYGQQYPPAAPGAGGFGRGIFGGLLGGMAGGWLYDKMRGGGSANASHGYGTGDPNQGMGGGGGGDYSAGGDFGSGGDAGGGGGGDYSSGGDF